MAACSSKRAHRVNSLMPSSAALIPRETGRSLPTAHERRQRGSQIRFSPKSSLSSGPAYDEARAGTRDPTSATPSASTSWRVPFVLLVQGTSRVVRATVTHGVFAERAQYLADIVDAIGEKYDFISPRDYFALLGDRSPRPYSPNRLLMTFDDGLLSSYDFIRTQLTPRGIRVIVFLPTAVLSMDREEQHNWALKTRFPGVSSLREEQYLTIREKEVLILKRDGHEVMPHSHTHARLSELSTAASLQAEIVAPKARLEELLPGRIDAFAFPYGSWDALSPLAHRWIGQTYAYCFTAIGGTTTSRSDPFLLRRTNLDQSHGARRVEASLRGLLDPYDGLKYRILRRRLRLDE